MSTRLNTSKFFLSIISFFVLSVSLGASSLLAIGGESSNESPSIPVPVKNYSAKIIDIENNAFDATRFSVNGKIYFQGMMGKSIVSIPFENIKVISVLSNAIGGDRKYYQSEISMKDGSSIKLAIPVDSKIYGDASFGKFELFMRDVKTIEIL